MFARSERFLYHDRASLEAAAAETPPQEMAQEAVEHYRRIVDERPTWEWPRICLRFAEDALRYLQSPHPPHPRHPPHPDTLRFTCRQFREETKWTKGIFDVWFLHDCLMERAEGGEGERPLGIESNE
jgi:hypothetical protein